MRWSGIGVVSETLEVGEGDERQGEVGEGDERQDEEVNTLPEEMRGMDKL